MTKTPLRWSTATLQAVSVDNFHGVIPVRARLPSRCYNMQPNIMLGPFAHPGYHPYMLRSHTTNGHQLPTCMDGVVLRYRNQHGWALWSSSKREVATR